jgi:hypothetical protein
LRAVHTLWTKPSTYKVKKKWFQESTDSIYTTRSSSEKYFMKNFELLTMVISTLLYKKYSGKIDLYTDDIGYQYLEQQEVTDLYDNVNVDVLNNFDSVRPDIYWAAGKVKVIQSQKEPFISLDTDAVIYDDVKKYIDKKDSLVGFHYEMFGNEFYPSRDDIKVVETYDWDEKLNWELLPINVAVTYFGDDVIKSHYTNECMRFMKENSEYVKNDYSSKSRMLFAEQRLLPMICNKLGREYKTILESIWNPSLNSWMHTRHSKFSKLWGSIFTHLWSEKVLLRNDETREINYCKNTITMIRNLDFDGTIYNKIKDIPQLNKFLF